MEYLEKLGDGFSSDYGFRSNCDLYSSEFLLRILIRWLKDKPFEKKVEFYQWIFKRVTNEVLVILLGVDEEFLVEVLEREVDLGHHISILFEKFFVDRPTCFELSQVEVEYEKPKWKKREEYYYKAIDLIIKKISGGEAKEGIAEFLKILQPADTPQLQDRVYGIEV